MEGVAASSRSARRVHRIRDRQAVDRGAKAPHSVHILPGSCRGRSRGRLCPRSPRRSRGSWSPRARRGLASSPKRALAERRQHQDAVRDGVRAGAVHLRRRRGHVACRCGAVPARQGGTAAQIHGNDEARGRPGPSRRRSIWIFITAFTFIKLGDINNLSPSVSTRRQPGRLRGRRLYAATDQSVPKGESMKIVVNGQQYVLRHRYPGRDEPAGRHGHGRAGRDDDPADVTADDVIDGGGSPSRRQDGRRLRLHQQDVVQFAGTRILEGQTQATTWASAPSCAAATTPRVRPLIRMRMAD